MPTRWRHQVAEQVDRWAGLDTAGTVPGDVLGYDRDELRGYQASRLLALRAALPRSTVSADDVLLDLGSGKGRVVLQAARHYPFKRVVGIELSSDLNAIAQVNVGLARDRLRCREIELILGDAASATIPADVSIVYLYNPFKGVVFDCAMERLCELVERRRFGVRIVYVHPVEHARLVAIRGVVEQTPPSPWRLRLGGLPAGSVRAYELWPSAATRVVA